MIGGIIALFTKTNNKYLSAFLSYSMIIMIGVSLFDLIPNGLPIIYDYYHFFTIFIVFILLIISLIIIKIINSVNIKEKGSLYKLGLISMIILMIHNFPEGIITFLTSINDYKIGIKLAIAIAIHNIPEGITIAMPIYHATHNKMKALKKTLLSSVAEPLGAIIAYIFLKDYVTKLSLAIILILIAGLMINLSIDEIVPEIKQYYHKKSIIIGIILGLLTIIIGISIV